MHASLILLTTLLLSADPAAIEYPRVTDDRLQLQLVAEAPDVRTPIGIAVDDQGRVLVVESHTHFRPNGYDGPMADRILRLEDFGPDGKARKITTFYEGLTHTMGLAIHPNGSVFVATRSEIFRLDGETPEGTAKTRVPIAHLETKGNYPHNGLSGFAFDVAGNVYFGFGENLGADYKLIGADGYTIFGGGEGGNIYRCSYNGENVFRLATGFWNPFHLTFDAYGRLFAVDNDPDSRPPCRLLHIVQGGDYGYRFHYGRKGVHPLTAWNGELPGTLPMVAGTGEAPSGVLSYESDNLPAEYRGKLLVTSWGDHRIEAFALTPRGASFSGEMTTLVTGGENFRPVGIALAPDGSIFFSDWVDKSYQLHGKGRVWRLSAKNAVATPRPTEKLAALACLHLPTRTAAANKLTKKEAHQQMTTSDDSIVRSLAARVWIDTATGPNGKEGRRRLPADPLAALYAAHSKAAAKKFANFHDGFSRGRDGSLSPTWLLEEEFSDELQAAALRTFMCQQTQLNPWLKKRNPQDRFLVQAYNSHLWPTESLMRFGESTTPPITFDEKLQQTMPVEQRRVWAQTLRLLHQRRVYATSQEKLLGGIPSLGVAMFLPKDPLGAIPSLLKDVDPEVCLTAIIWIAEEKLKQFRPEMEQLLETQVESRQLFEACLAALEILSDKPYNAKQESRGEEHVFKILDRENASPSLKRFALRTLRPDHPQLTMQRLTTLLASPDEGLKLEAIRSLRERSEEARHELLRGIASDQKLPARARCEAIVGLSPENAANRQLLLTLAEAGFAEKTPEITTEALRAFRGTEITAAEQAIVDKLAPKPASPAQRPAPTDLAAWMQYVAGEGDAAAGERIFFHPRVASCYRCHEQEGRGNVVGPALATLGKGLSRERIVQSIVEPSREIAPQFTPWTLLLKDGTVKTGLYLSEEVDGTQNYVDATGHAFKLHPRDLESRTPSRQSIMPAGIAESLAPQEFRDLLAYLLRK